jgi:hypothetical protein
MWKIVRYAVGGAKVVGIGTFPSHANLFFYRRLERLATQATDSSRRVWRSTPDRRRITSLVSVARSPAGAAPMAEDHLGRQRLMDVVDQCRSDRLPMLLGILAAELMRQGCIAASACWRRVDPSAQRDEPQVFTAALKQTATVVKRVR